MNTLIIILIVLLSVWLLLLNYKIEKEKKRNRILQSFVAGTIRAISDYKSATDDIDMPKQNNKLPISYDNILDNIDWEFSKDFWIEPYQKWLKHDRNLFNESKYGGDGFNFIYYDFFDARLREWHSEKLLSEKDKEYLCEDIQITEDNVSDLEGEISMLKYILNGKHPIDSFNPNNISETLAVMFPHIKLEKQEEGKKQILKQMNL